MSDWWSRKIGNQPSPPPRTPPSTMPSSPSNIRFNNLHHRHIHKFKHLLTQTVKSTWAKQFVHGRVAKPLGAKHMTALNVAVA